MMTFQVFLLSESFPVTLRKTGRLGNLEGILHDKTVS